jgi:TonB-linked SusC/RagA family outer membrane protein
MALLMCMSLQARAGHLVGDEEDGMSLNIAQEERVAGVVKDRSGEPLVGVNVFIKGTSTGVVSDPDGRYRITVPDETAVLVFSYVGFASQEVTVGSRRTIDIVLSESVDELEEVVVVGYGVQKKVNLSGAVQSVAGKEIANRPVNNINSALQGAAANMNITNYSGRATAAPDINIRGYTSINGGSAFILVDNVPASAAEMARLNPSDIESVSVLKDASASAIYGSRAAYGVVLVTTKKAQSKDLQINFDASYVMRQSKRLEYELSPLKILQYSNAADYPDDHWLDAYLPYAERIAQDPSLPRTVLDPANTNNWYYYGEYEWYNEMVREFAPSYNANLNISRTDDKLSYYVSGAYFRQDGVADISKTDLFDRYNLRANATYKLTPWWDLGTNMSFVNSTYERPVALTDDYFFRFFHSSTMQMPVNPDGSWSSRGAYAAYLEEGGRKKNSLNETRISINTAFDLIRDTWQVKADATYRWANTGTDSYNVPVYIKRGPDQPLQQSFFTEMANNNGLTYANNTWAQNDYNLTRQTVYNLYTDFHKTFGGKHYVQALAGFNREYLVSNTFWVFAEGLTTTALPTIQMANGYVNKGQNIYDYALQGYFFRLNYIFDNRYILEANGRYDGTSSYPPGKRWGFFPSGSAAWVLSREKFFESAGESLKIDLLKLRTSYGALGNQTMFIGGYESGTGLIVQGETNYYPYIPSMSQREVTYLINGSKPQGVYMPDPVSQNQTWEKVTKFNLGLDLSLLRNRLDVSFDWYNQQTVGMLTKTRTLPAVFGAGVPRENAADLENKGWELNVGWRDEYQVGNAPLSLSLRFMIADSKTYITKYANPTRNLGDYYEGQEIGKIWGYVNDGFFATDEEALAANQNNMFGSNTSKKAGDLKYADLDGDGKISSGEYTVDNPGDMKIIGNSEAHFPYSFELNAAWKGFDLRAFFYGIGQKDWYPGGGHLVFWGTANATGDTPQAVLAHTMDYWREDNQDAYFPRPKYRVANDGEAAKAQTRYLQDASYLRLKNLTLGYTLPAGLTRQWKISNLRFYLSCENLWTLSHMYVDFIDPEILSGRGERELNQRKNTGYPFTKNYSAGINMSF